MRRENRKLNRLTKECKVTVTVLKTTYSGIEAGSTTTGVTSDLSGSGICFISSTSFPMSTKVKMLLECPNTERTYTMVGMVRWASTGLTPDEIFVGVEFIKDECLDLTGWLRLISSGVTLAQEEDGKAEASDDRSIW